MADVLMWECGDSGPSVLWVEAPPDSAGLQRASDCDLYALPEELWAAYLSTQQSYFAARIALEEARKLVPR